MPIKVYNDIAIQKKADYYQRKKSDPIFKEKKRNWNKSVLSKNPRPAFIRSLISNYLKPRKTGIRRPWRIKYNLGYTPDDLVKHIETQFLDGMTWENRGIVWEVDHIKPISSFHENDHPSLINALSNIRPIWKIVNQRKAAKLHYNG